MCVCVCETVWLWMCGSVHIWRPAEGLDVLHLSLCPCHYITTSRLKVTRLFSASASDRCTSVSARRYGNSLPEKWLGLHDDSFRRCKLWCHWTNSRRCAQNKVCVICLAWFRLFALATCFRLNVLWFNTNGICSVFFINLFRLSAVIHWHRY